MGPPPARRSRKLKAQDTVARSMRLALRRSGPAVCLLLAGLLAGCDRPETDRATPGLELVHWDSLAASDGYVEVFRVTLVREDAAWADVNVTLDGAPQDAERRDADGDGRTSVGDEVRLRMPGSAGSRVLALEAPGRVLGALEFRTGAGQAA